VISWLKRRFSQPQGIAVMDLGCGNGHFTVKLLESGFSSLGALDYSAAAVELARQFIATTKFYEDPDDYKDVQIYAADILQPTSIPESDKYRVIVDKGTFDAISLSGQDTLNEIAPAFKHTLKRLSKTDPNQLPLFIITSCNWTTPELKAIFEPELTAIDEIAHSSFTFGGKRGQDVSTVIFEIN
jgi:SAM-dependent methyltransferase